MFMLLEAVYVLVFDLTKDLFSTAQCNYTDDTNLDHMMRWLDLVHTLRPSEENGCNLRPPVVLVGTHADELVNPDEKMDEVKKFLMRNACDFFKHIVNRLTVENKLAGQHPMQGEEDRRIIRLREVILKVGNAMPRKTHDVPLKWLEVENEVFDHVTVKKGEKYMTKQKFKVEIVDKVIPPDLQGDVEHLLNFLHDRGAVVYHDCGGNPDDLVVLDPQWLIHDVLCKIINVKERDEGEEGGILLYREELKDKGILHAKLLHYECKNLQLDDIEDSLIGIMKKFNLLFESKNKDGDVIYIVPCMVPTRAAEDLICPVIQGYEPVFITFSTNFVPAGLFSRLLVLFGKWAALRKDCEMQDLSSNAARLFVGSDTCVGFACFKTVIKIHIWTMNKSNPTEAEPHLASEVYR